MFVYIMLVLILLFSFIMWFLLNIRKKIELVPNIDEKLFKRIRNKGKLTEEYSTTFLVLAVLDILGICAYTLIPGFGRYIAVILIVLGGINIGNFSQKVNDNIRKNKY